SECVSAGPKMLSCTTGPFLNLNFPLTILVANGLRTSSSLQTRTPIALSALGRQRQPETAIARDVLRAGQTGEREAERPQSPASACIIGLRIGLHLVHAVEE